MGQFKDGAKGKIKMGRRAVTTELQGVHKAGKA